MYTIPELVFGIAVAIEMITFNLLTVHKCCERKYSVPLTIIIASVFTLLIVSITTLSSTILGLAFVQRGNGVLLLVGWLYLIPCCIVYKGTLRNMITKVLVMWSFTYSVLSISVAIAKLFTQFEFIVVLFIVQSIIYALTAYHFLRFAARQFTVMLNTLSVRTQNMLIINGALWFALVVTGNLLTVYAGLAAINVLFTVLLMAGAMVTFVTLARIVGVQQHADRLEIVAFTDTLTGLNNRASLFDDAQKLVDANQPFVLIFADINYLKQLNDAYGHIYGDNYLKLFAEQSVKKLGKNGKLYRISGDEFVCIYTGRDGQKEFIESLRTPREGLANNVTYYGCGVGCAFFPNDGESLDKLIGLADKRMYVDKEENKPYFAK